MRLNEITADEFKNVLKHGPRYRVYVMSPLGKHYEGEKLSYEKAKYLLNDIVGQYQSDVFPEEPAADVRWSSDGEVAVMTIPSYKKDEPDRKIEFAMEKDNRA